MAGPAPGDSDSERSQPSGAGKNGGKTPKDKRSFSQKKGSYLPEIHRQLPASIDAEKGLLGSILLSPTHVLDMCIEQKVGEEHFYIPSHSKIFLALSEMAEKGTPIDIVTLSQYLTDRALMDQLGGPVVLADLFTFVPTATNADYYINILCEKYLLRKVITTCTEFASRSYDEQGDARLLLDEVEKRVFEIGEQRFRGELPGIKEHVMAAVNSIEHLYQNKGGLTGLSTGFKQLDNLTSGLHGGEMIVIAARPSMGKTALAMNIAEHVAVECGKPVAIYSLEMSSQQLVQRLLCSLAKIDLGRIRDGFLQKSELPKLAAAANKLQLSQIYIDDTAGMNILELRAKARRLRERHRIELIVIDYLQLLRSPSKRGQENRQLEVAEISAGIKALSKELDIPILVLAQLNRQPDERGGRPMISHLRESGTIEQDADVVGLLYRAEIYEKDKEAREEKAGEAELIIAKQRNGPVGDIPLTFLKEYTRFEDRAIEHSHDE